MQLERRIYSRARSWLIAGAIAIFGAGAAANGATLETGAQFPQLDQYEFTGAVPNLDGAKVVIVDFWASWCAPCKASFPVFEKLSQDYGEQGLVVVAVSVDQSPKAYEAFLKRMKPTFAVVRDNKQKLVADVDVPTMPTSFVLDGKGEVRFVHQGFFGEKSRQDYVDEIKSILAEKS